MDRLCWDCGARTDDDRQVRCDCGEPLSLDGDPERVPEDWPPRVDSMWDLVPYLGLDAPEPPAGIASAAGGTPLVRTERLDDAGPRIYVKPEGLNPTGSFKDRGTAFGLAAALAAGDDHVGTVSHGNMAASVAAHTASVGLDCTVLVPADIADERLSAIAAYDPRLLRVEGDYGKLYFESLEVGRETGVRFLNSDVPLRVAGQATTALETLAQFAEQAAGESAVFDTDRQSSASDVPDTDRQSSASDVPDTDRPSSASDVPDTDRPSSASDVPDALVLPVSSGGHASGTWQAVRTLEEAGVVDEPPRLYFVQTAACAPIAEAYARGDETVTPVEAGETVAYSIANADPPSGARALAAARATDGAVVAVDDDQIERAGERLAEAAGLAVEPASATTLAAVSDLVDDGELGADDDVVLVATGRGFGGTGSAAESEQVPLAALRAALE